MTLHIRGYDIYVKLKSYKFELLTNEGVVESFSWEKLHETTFDTVWETDYIYMEGVTFTFFISMLSLTTFC